MALKFVANEIVVEEKEVPVNSTQTTIEETPYSPESVTTLDNSETATGFELSFTDDVTYDLDEILLSIRRDNPDSELLMHVITENSIEEQLIQIITEQLLTLYSTDNINNIPNFGTLLSKRYEQEIATVDITLSSSLLEGSLTINETQPKIGVKKEDIGRYLLSNTKAKRSAPVVNLNRPIVIWTEENGDLNQPDAITTFSNIYNYIKDLEQQVEDLELELHNQE